MSTLASEQDDVTSQVTLLEQSIVGAVDASVARDHDFSNDNAKDCDFNDENAKVPDYSDVKDNDFNDETAKNDDFNNADATIQRNDSGRFLAEMNSCEMDASFTVCRDQSTSSSTSPHLIGGKGSKIFYSWDLNIELWML